MVDAPDSNPAETPPAPAAPPGSPEAPPPSRTRQARGCIVELLQTLLATIVLFLLIQGFVAQPFQVEQHSMEQTFLDGDHLIVDRLSHLWSPYARGQVIVFHPPASVDEAGQPFIKRVIGVAGDTVELRGGKVWVNGVALDEPYLYRDAGGNIEPTDPISGTSSWLVPAGDLFVLGDHRQKSEDSRVFGPIEVSSVIGRGVLRYWPFDRFGVIVAATYDNLPAP